MSDKLELQRPLQASAIQVTELPKLDLDSYIANYDGQSRLDRLVCIATSSQLPVSKEALRLALAEAKKGKDVDRYLEISQYAVDNDKDASTDVEWATKTRELVNRETQKLEHELKGYKNNLIKESIRMGNEDLGHHYYSIGDNNNAYKAYMRMREFCTTPKHLVDMSLRLVLVGAAQENWMAVQTSLYKIQALQLKPEDKAKIDPVINPIAGLANMASGNYPTAADRFLNADPAYIALDTTQKPSAGVGSGLGISFQRQLITPNDVAVYGALCALATLNREELQRRILDNADFRTFLELEPHLRRVVAYFIGGKYTQALEILEGYRADYLFDVFLQKHVDPLYATIRRKAICAYVAPFSRLSLSSMATAFPVFSPSESRIPPTTKTIPATDTLTDGSIQTELVSLISSGQLSGFRIDAVHGELVALAKDDRRLTHEKALKVASETERALRLKLYRVNMMAAGFEVKAGKASMGEGQGSGIATRSNRGRGGADTGTMI
ncbi:hypothetical protein FH972_022578 [Carpinus fangiana]|uniref:PCI domain-containing protein n=1 Tax=Carpinus fangiana TaxID=176857 RepID=A0A5N6KSM9_9ROSI|nr:hypothetical protein FH972_022578 [Carpinus fangiana]